MRSIYHCLFIFLTSLSLRAQSASTLDSSFATNGIYQANIGQRDVIVDMVRLPNGRVFAAGYIESDQQSSFAVFRFKPDGTLDPAFGQGGVAQFAVPGSSTNIASCLALTADGSIIVGGHTRPNNSYDEDFVLLRFTSTGSLDESFGTDGLVTKNIGFQDHVTALAIDAGQKIVVAGTAQFGTGNTSQIVLARFVSNGNWDLDFGSNGHTITSIGTDRDVATSVAIQPDGKLVVAGATTFNGWSDVAILRYHTDGLLDTDFGDDGLLAASLSATGDAALKCVIQPDGRILTAGYAYNNANRPELALFRCTADGDPDVEFGDAGIVRAPVGSLSSMAEALAVRPDGKILVGGTTLVTATKYDVALRQFHPDGLIDSSFGTNGVLRTDINGRHDGLSDLELQADGKVLVSATTANDSSRTNLALLRYLTDLNVGIVEAAASLAHPLVYPNPVSAGVLTIGYELPGASSVAIELYDTAGRLLGTLARADRAAGVQQQSFELPAGLTGGTYLLNVRTARGNAVVRIAVSR
jgi:uncharacterized delta-60 repeat protein